MATLYTTDLNANALDAVILNEGIDQTTSTSLVSWFVNHLPADGLTPVEFDYNLGDQINTPIPDAEGTHPQLLILEGGSDYIDTTAFTGLHTIIFSDLGIGWNFLTVTGSHSESIYLGDLTGPSTDGYTVFLNDSGNDTVIEGYNNGIGVFAGAGRDTVTLGMGTGDNIFGGSGSYQHLTANGKDATIIAGTGDHQILSGGSGADDLIGHSLVFSSGSGAYDVLYGSSGGRDSIFEGSGSHQKAYAEGPGDSMTGGSGTDDLLSSAFTGTTFNDGTGTNQKIVGTGGNDVFNITQGSNDTIISKGGNDIINVSGEGHTVTIQGTAADTLNIAEEFGAATITNVKGTVTLKFTDGEVVNVTGIHQAVFDGIVHTF